jgi:hypothetical protein
MIRQEVGSSSNIEFLDSDIETQLVQTMAIGTSTNFEGCLVSLDLES